MRKNALVTGILLFFVASSFAQSKFEITLKNNTPAEAQTKAQLERLIKTYDLSAWSFTNKIEIDEKAIPHSHPVLTLHARHLKDDDLLLSTYVHEQIHWHFTSKRKESEEAFKELRAMFPNPPDKAPEGSRDLESTYLHLFVCYLEYRAVRELLGELRAKQVMDFWATDHYLWVYKTVVERRRDIGGILIKHKLMISPGYTRL
jgi:hypothetical protein